jgi:putative DNA primase/helicase
MSDAITDRANGRWKDILAALGVPSKLTSGKNQSCPFCPGGGGRDRFRFTNYEGRGGFICSQCGGGSGFDLLMRLKGWSFKEAAKEVEGVIGSCRKVVTRDEDNKRKAMNDLWFGSRAIEASDPAGRYLYRRCGLTEFPLALRSVSSLRYFGSPDSFPAMLAKLTKPDGHPCSIHRTYLTVDGQKAPVEAPRRMMPGTIAKGSAVRLAPMSETMGIAEGIETAISAEKLFGIPTWAALNSELLKAWEPPAGVIKVIIFGDNDENYTGQTAAFSLAKRLVAVGVRAEIKIPDEIGHDWNDVLHQRSVAA